MMATTCPRCGKEDVFGDMRFRSGRFAEKVSEGKTVLYELLCEDCHRDVVRS